MHLISFSLGCLKVLSIYQSLKPQLLFQSGVPKPRGGWIQNTACGMLLTMLLKLRKTNFFSDWGNQKKGEEWGETPIVSGWMILLYISMWQSARVSVSETPPQPGPCCYWAQIAVEVTNQKSYSWLQHPDMVPGLLLHLSPIREPLHHTLLHGKDRTMAHWLPGALSGAPPVQLSDTFALKNSSEFPISQAAPGVTCWKLFLQHI